MKKWFAFAIGLYVLTMAAILIIPGKQVDTISIITVINHESRLIDDDDSESFDMYLTKTDSFLTDNECISEAYMESNQDVIRVNLTGIEDLEETVLWNNEEYHRFQVKYGFDSVGLEGVMAFPDACFHIVYKNGDEISLSIGDLYFLFCDLDTEGCLDFFSVYGVYGEYEEKTYLSGICIGLEIASLSDVIIDDVSIGSLKTKIKTGEYAYSTNRFDYMQDMSELLSITSYDPEMSYRLDTKITLEEDGYLLFPIQYEEGIFMLRRFYISIKYEYMGEEYNLLIDDMPYESMPAFSDIEDECIARTDYNYR